MTSKLLKDLTGENFSIKPKVEVPPEKDPASFNRKQLKVGKEAEAANTTDTANQSRFAMQNLSSNPDYYKKSSSSDEEVIDGYKYKTKYPQEEDNILFQEKPKPAAMVLHSRKAAKVKKSVDFLNKLEKAAGEGSKGGKVIGHTKSGKPIYESFAHPAHADFTPEEHMSAAEAQKEHRINTGVKKPFNPEFHEASKKESEKHKEAAKTKKKVSLVKSLVNLEKAGKTGEGSRGGRIIGHTAAGKPIYAKEGVEVSDYKKEGVHPGVEAHKIKPDVKEHTLEPTGGWDPHYSDKDTPGLSSYKALRNKLWKEGFDMKGHITLNPKTGEVKSLTKRGDAMIQHLNDIASGSKKAE
jgi:hypothetical protein